MLGPIGSHLISMLKILTPEEIESYVQKERKVETISQIAVGAQEMATDQHHTGRDTFDRHSSDQEETPQEVEDESSKAKILPFDKKYKKTQLKQSSVFSSPKVPSSKKNKKHTKGKTFKSTGGLSSMLGIDEEQEREELQRIEEEKSRVSATEFLLQEREHYKSAVKKLRGRGAVSSYSQNVVGNQMSASYSDDADEEEDEVVKGDKGILINKKYS